MGSSGVALNTLGYRQEILPFVGGYNLVGTWPAGGGANAGDVFGAVFQNTSAAQNDAISYDFWLPAGTFALDLLYRKIAAGGIIHLALNGTGVADIDTYNIATQDNVVTTQAGIVVASTGLQTMRMSVNAKNASSSGFVIQTQLFVWRRTA